jgi:hypothetical protein
MCLYPFSDYDSDNLNAVHTLFHRSLSASSLGSSPMKTSIRTSRLCLDIRTAELNNPQPWNQRTCSTVHIAAKQAKSVSESGGGNEFVSSSHMFTYVRWNCIDCTVRWRVSGKSNTWIDDECYVRDIISLPHRSSWELWSSGLLSSD